MAERRRRVVDEPPLEALVAALHRSGERERAVDEKYGKRLNTVRGTRCRECGADASMTVHPEHAVYHPCGCSFPLPPIGITDPRRKRTVKAKGAAK